MKLKSVLNKAEEASKELAQLSLKNLKLISINVTKDNPDTGHFRLKGFLNQKDFIEIFEFYFSRDLLKYSYVLIKENISVLRFDNAPHHKELKSFPHHIHYKDTIKAIEKPSLKGFVKEVLKLIK